MQRFVAGMPETFGDYGLDPRFVEAEVEQMTSHRFAKTERPRDGRTMPGVVTG